MPDTFASVWRAVRLHAGDPPPLLCQYWVKQAWRQLCARRGWSFLRAETQFLVDTQKTGTASVVYGSSTVTGVTLVFAATDVNRQFRVSGGSVYTILTVDVGLNTCTLDRVYGATTSPTASCVILDAYVTCPADFARFIAVIDEVNGWPLNTTITEDQLNAWDPQRSQTDSAWAMAARRLASTAALDGRAQYELWPYMASAHQYHASYFRSPDVLSETYIFEGVLAERGDILISGALAEAASWPGTSDHRNPYFNLALAQAKRAEFLSELIRLGVRDEEVYLTWLQTVDSINRPPWGPQTADYLRCHDGD